MTNSELASRFVEETSAELSSNLNTISAIAHSHGSPLARLFVGNYTFGVSALDGQVVVNSPEGYGASIKTNSTIAAASFIYGWIKYKSPDLSHRKN